MVSDVLRGDLRSLNFAMNLSSNSLTGLKLSQRIIHTRVQGQMSVVAILAITMGFRDWMQVCVVFGRMSCLEPPYHEHKVKRRIFDLSWRYGDHTYIL